ncbi:MAG: autotransporter-associated beta strand repeat-containing protein [Verrucomicrobia bacterium]|nr:autotransporter-associated beta strand repeat-containing protein [Verrucomicrobiota bacterium]
MILSTFPRFLTALCAVTLIGAAPLLAAPDVFYVADHKDDGPYMTGAGSGNTGDLRYCIVQSNNSTNPEGSIINIYDYPTITRGMLPITRTVTIRSDPNLAPQIYAVSGGYLGRPFFIDAPPSHVVRIANLAIRFCRAVGGNGGPSAGGGAGLGGAIFVNSGQLVIENVFFDDIGAIGGNGGASTSFMGGGGGGLGGNGGAQGGGGGGYRGNGGNGGDNNAVGVAGGGGGGLIGNGANGRTDTVINVAGGGGGTANAVNGAGQGGGGNGGANNSSSGTDGSLYGGGGGGGAGSNSQNPPPLRTAGNGGKFGGGGGGSTYGVSAPGHGGDFGGGGGGLYIVGGNGGYGGGGGSGGQNANGGNGGFGGGNGKRRQGGDGGSAYGGIIFVRGATGAGPVTILETPVPAGFTTAGAGGAGGGSGGTEPGIAGLTGGTSIYQEAINGAQPPPLIFDTSVDRSVFGTIGSSSSGNITLRKRGAGRLLFETPHDYFGFTVIEQGTLRLAPSGGNLGTSLASVDGTLDLNGNHITLRGLASVGGGGVVTTSTTGSNLTVTLNSDGLTSDFGGSLTNGPGGTLSLVKTGTSVQQLGGQSAFTGGTTVNGGQLRTSAPNTAFGALGRGNVTIGGTGEILVLGSNSFMGFDTNSLPGRTVRLNAGGTLRAASGVSQHLVALVLAGGTLAATDPEPTFGTWNFDRGVSTPGGGTVSNITGGNATLGQAGGTIFNIGNGDTLNVSTVLDELMGSTGLRKTGPGTLVLTGLNTYTSGTSVEAGKLTLGNGGASGAIRGTLSIAAGTTVDATAGNGFGFSTGTKVNAVTLAGGTLLNSSSVDLGWGVAYTLSGGTMSSNGGTPSATAGSKFAFGGPAGGPTSVNATTGTTTTIAGRVDLRSDNGNPGTAFNTENGATLNVTAAVTTSSAAQTLTKTGPGTLTLTGPNTYAGQTLLQGGVLGIGSATALGTSTVRFNGGTLRYLGVNQDISANLTSNGTGSTSIDTNGQNVTFATPIGGTNGLTKSGAGTLILNAANTYSGTTSLAGGLLGYANAGSFGSSRLTFNGGTLQYIGLSTDLSGLFNAGGSGAISVDTNGQSVTFASPLNNSFGLTKAGAGRLELTAANSSLAGTVTLGGGSLRLSAANQLGAARITFAGGTLAYATGFATDLSPLINTPSTAAYSIDPGGQTVTFGTALSGSAGLTKVGPGTLVLAADNGINGPTSIQGGTLQVGNGGATGAIGANAPIVNNGALVYARTGSLFQGGAISGSGSLTVGGGLVLGLTGNHTYTGATTITGGSSLVFSGTASLYNSGQVAGSTITLEAGSSLVLDGNDLLGNYNSTPVTTLVAQAGALVRNTNTFTTFKDLTLNGAELRASGGVNVDLPAYLIRGTVTVGGSSPSSITATATVNANDLVNLGPLTTFAVADVTSSPAPDLTISTRLKDNYQATEPTAGTLRKTGPGTLLLTAVNTYGGWTYVDAGTLALGASATAGVGPIAVASGATFDVTALGAAGFTLASGRTLTNDGTIQGVLAVSGSFLGNGSIQGGLVVNTGATVERTSGSLAVTGTITNHGTLRIRNGAVLDASGVTSIVNHGVIDLITAGPATSFPALAISGSGLFLAPGGVSVKTATRVGNTVTVRVDGFVSHTYQLQRSTSLATDTFTNVGAPQAGAGTTAPFEMIFTDSNAPAGPVFYRVVVTG